MLDIHFYFMILLIFLKSLNALTKLALIFNQCFNLILHPYPLQRRNTLSWAVRCSGWVPRCDCQCGVSSVMESRPSPVCSPRSNLSNFEKSKETVSSVSERRRGSVIFLWCVCVCIHYCLNTQSDPATVKKRTYNDYVCSESSHPNLSTVREDIRFSLQPVSISTFTCCPKHCQHTEMRSWFKWMSDGDDERPDGKKHNRKRNKKTFIHTKYFLYLKNYSKYIKVKSL